MTCSDGFGFVVFRYWAAADLSSLSRTMPRPLEDGEVLDACYCRELQASAVGREIRVIQRLAQCQCDIKFGEKSGLPRSTAV